MTYKTTTAAAQYTNNETAQASKIEQKQQKYISFFANNAVYLDIENTNEKSYVERELRTLFGRKPETFLNNRIKCIITDGKSNNEHLKKTIKEWDIMMVSLLQFKNTMIKYFGRKATSIANSIATINNNGPSASAGLRSDSNRNPFIEFKQPYILISDSLGNHRPIFKEYTEFIKCSLSSKSNSAEEKRTSNSNAPKTLPIIQLPFLGMAFLVPSQAGGSPFHHVYDNLPFPNISSTKQSLLQSMNNSTSRHLQTRNLYQPFLAIPSFLQQLFPDQQVGKNTSSSTSGPMLRKLQRKVSPTLNIKELEAKVSLEQSHKEKKRQATEYFRKKRESNTYPFYKFSNPKNDSKPPPGYCECCLKKYDDLDAHLKEPEHQHFAHNDANYAQVDISICVVQRKRLRPTELVRNITEHNQLLFGPEWNEFDIGKLEAKEAEEKRQEEEAVKENNSAQSCSYQSEDCDDNCTSDDQEEYDDDEIENTEAVNMNVQSEEASSVSETEECCNENDKDFKIPQLPQALDLKSGSGDITDKDVDATPYRIACFENPSTGVVNNDGTPLRNYLNPSNRKTTENIVSNSTGNLNDILFDAQSQLTDLDSSKFENVSSTASCKSEEECNDNDEDADLDEHDKELLELMRPPRRNIDDEDYDDFKSMSKFKRKRL